MNTSTIEAAIWISGRWVIWRASSGRGAAPSWSPRYSTTRTPMMIPMKRYMTSSSRAEAVM